MSVKLTQVSVKQFAKGIKKVIKESPELMQKITKDKPELLKSNGKISTKALQKVLISSDAFTPSGKLTQEAKNEIKDFIDENKLSSKISPKKFFKAVIKAEQNTPGPVLVSEEIISKTKSKFNDLSNLKVDFEKSASKPYGLSDIKDDIFIKKA